MELIDLLSGFDLSKISDKNIQMIARGLTAALILEPVKDMRFSAETVPAMKQRVSDACVSYMKKAITGGLFDKIALAASIKKKAGKPENFPAPKLIQVDTKPLVQMTSAMHVHHMKESDYRAIGDEIARIAFGTGKSAELLENTLTVYERDLVEEDVLSKIYTGLQLALNEKDTLVRMAEESKARAQGK